MWVGVPATVDKFWEDPWRELPRNKRVEKTSMTSWGVNLNDLCRSNCRINERGWGNGG